MNHTSFIALSCLATLACSTTWAESQAKLPMDKRDFGKTQHRDSATSEWLKSWHAGEVYKTSAEYDFHADLEVAENKDSPYWLKRWVARKVTDGISTIEKGAFFGKAISTTFVYQESPHLRLVRDWQYVQSYADWGATATPKNDVVKGCIGSAVKGDWLGRENRKAFYTGLKFMAPGVGEFLSTWGEGGYEITSGWLGQNFGTFDEEGRLNIPTNSVIAKAMGAAERQKILAMAVAVSQNVNGKKTAIAQDGAWTRRVREIADLRDTSADPGESFETFDASYLAKGREPHPDLAAIVKRESFSVTSELFDQEIRNPGDVWVVDAEFFNSFLHPDLKGAFTGTAVVTYEADEEGDNAYWSVPMKAIGRPRAYDVRRIRVLRRGTVNGATVATDLKYDEKPVGGRFSARYDDDRSEIWVLVDKKSGHVVFAEIELFADNVEALPMLSLTDGFKATGKANLTMTFRGDVFSREELGRDPTEAK